MKILSGELFIVLYTDGKMTNRWAVNAGKDPIVLNKGHLIRAGIVDVLTEPNNDPETEFKNNRWHVVEGADQIQLLKDGGFRTQVFGSTNLKVYNILEETDIFNTGGTKIGTIPAGSEIGLVDGDAGNNSKHLLAVNAYDSMDGKGWRFLNQSTYTYGFVNIQSGFGLKMYNSDKVLETPKSEIQNVINWEEVAIAQSGKLEEREAFLRDLPGEATKEDLIQNINEYFAFFDLDGEFVGDPSLYFANLNVHNAVSRALEENGFTDTKEKFDSEREHFLSL